MLNRLLRTHLRPYRRELAAVLVFQLVGTTASLYLPRFNADIIDFGIARKDTGYILTTGGWMLLVTMLQVACLVVVVYFSARCAMGFGRDVRVAVFDRIGEFSAREVGGFGPSSLITRVTNDVQQVQLLVTAACSTLIAAPITCVLGVVMALREDTGLAWLLVVCVSLLLAAFAVIVIRATPQFRAMQERIDQVGRVLREQLSGIRVVRAFVREQAEIRRFGDANSALTRVATKAGQLQSLSFPAVMLILNLSSVAVLWFGARRVDAGDMRIGAMIAFLNYLTLILASVTMATVVSTMIPRAAICAERVAEVLDTPPSVLPPQTPEPGPHGPTVEFSKAGFRRSSTADPVVRDVTFRAEAGTTTAIIGSTGAGKTTVLSLVPRLMDVTGGSVLVGDTDVRELSPEALREAIGLVPQKPHLFTGTVATNLRYGNSEATDAELWQALETAQARDFVEALNDGLNAPVTQGGTNLSGGQRQRLAIARALVRRPEIYLFDDAFSALDLATEARLRAALRPYTERSVVIVVAQRVSSILDADQIVVLDNGSVTGIGTHAQLLETCPTYLEIVQSQLPPEPTS